MAMRVVLLKEMHDSYETHIGLDRDDLADAAERLEEAGKLRPAYGDAHARAGLGQRPHHMAANEARAAIDGDEGRAA